MPPIIKEWHRSIGNLRAWPLEINRALGDAVPRIKLETPMRQEKAPPYYLPDVQALRMASFINDEWPQWKASTPPGADFPHNYLSHPQGPNDKACRPALIRAITLR